ncbi:MAG: 2-amino-4-hydroxy-6-hydroxymethyldihydropteridine diphosphokinase [Pseudomonadota bacterium]|nr:2-amino-4-hydroxy-6-hydroxymethyldihydropteridine diphosphokinase [Pseudomonadota bacterium]
MIEAYLSAGSNITPEKNLKLACMQLAKHYGDLELSPVYRNPAEGFLGDEFLNMVIGFKTDESPEQIIERIELIHKQARRQRTKDKFSSRTLDLDLLLYGNEIRRNPKIPHQDIENYGFVAKPLSQIAPKYKHPITGKTMLEIWEGFEVACSMQEISIGLLD